MTVSTRSALFALAWLGLAPVLDTVLASSPLGAQSQRADQARDLPTGTVLVAGMDDDSVWLVDLPSGERRGVVSTHIAPHEVAVSHDGRMAVVTNYGLQVPYRLAVTSDGATIVVSDPEAVELVLIDRASGEVRARVDVRAAATASGFGPDVSPQGFTLSPDGRWAFVSTKGIDRVAVVDLDAPRVTTFISSGAGPDGIAFTPVRVRGEGVDGSP